MGKVTVNAGETWQSVAERTTGPGTHPAIIDANGGHPDHQPEPGSEIDVPGYEETAPEQEAAPEPAQPVTGDAGEEADDEEEGA